MNFIIIAYLSISLSGIFYTYICCSVTLHHHHVFALSLSVGAVAVAGIHFSLSSLNTSFFSLNCSGNESSIDYCTQSTTGDCSGTSNAGAVCRGTHTSCMENLLEYLYMSVTYILMCYAKV